MNNQAVELWLSYVGKNAPSNAAGNRVGLGYTKEEATERAAPWANQAPWEKHKRVLVTDSGLVQAARDHFAGLALGPREALTPGEHEALKMLDATGWQCGYASAWLAAYPLPAAVAA